MEAAMSLEELVNVTGAPPVLLSKPPTITLSRVDVSTLMSLYRKALATSRFYEDGGRDRDQFICCVSRR